MDELIHCHLETSSCPLLMASQGAPLPSEAVTPPRPPAPLYVGVTSWVTQHPQHVALLGVLLAGTTVNRTREMCHAEDTDPVSLFTLIYWFIQSSLCDPFLGILYQTLGFFFYSLKLLTLWKSQVRPTAEFCSQLLSGASKYLKNPSTGIYWDAQLTSSMKETSRESEKKGL